GGAQQLFNLHFVRPGIYDAATSRLMARLQKFREEADYAQAFVVEETGAREELAGARELVTRIRSDLP
ncbi:MAG TPA: DNA-binding protein, partial [Thermoanaerobaculia bacterium]|nr:DNA-binding protein [Thermoanaerobaculia bacterium]